MAGITTLVSDDDIQEARAECWCRGTVAEPGQIIQLGTHPEVSLCARCGHWAGKRAWELQDRTKTAPSLRLASSSAASGGTLSKADGIAPRWSVVRCEGWAAGCPRPCHGSSVGVRHSEPDNDPRVEVNLALGLTIVALGAFVARRSAPCVLRPRAPVPSSGITVKLRLVWRAIRKDGRAEVDR